MCAALKFDTRQVSSAAREATVTMYCSSIEGKDTKLLDLNQAHLFIMLPLQSVRPAVDFFYEGILLSLLCVVFWQTGKLLEILLQGE